ncbi:MAG: flagellin [Candidatus Marinimicrobia bacterium]|nr:flagellin [Candidatus Neomarinimicrobiota bacterium]|tara:strand:- start:1925 stop:2884 length:960 start_codon:yes stop_codon:yes gene_type:complete
MFGDLTRVGANFHAMEAWSNLKKVNGDIGQIQSRLSSGKRINSAEDDTSGYALSKHLESRVRGLSQALDNVGTAKNVLNIAEGGFQSQMTILQTVKEKLTQAADGSLSNAQRGAIGDQIDALLTEIDDINSDTKFNDNSLMGGGRTRNAADNGWDVSGNGSMTFQVGEGNGDILSVTLDNSYRRDIGESTTAVDLDSIVVQDADTANGSATATSTETSTAWAALSQTEAAAGISTADSAIKALAKSIQSVGDYNARLSSKEESLSLAVSNTEATRSRIEDADFAKEQMSMMKLQILQQTSVSAFSQANAAPQVVMSLFR